MNFVLVFQERHVLSLCQYMACTLLELSWESWLHRPWELETDWNQAPYSQMWSVKSKKVKLSHQNCKLFGQIPSRKLDWPSPCWSFHHFAYSIYVYMHFVYLYNFRIALQQLICACNFSPSSKLLEHKDLGILFF